MSFLPCPEGFLPTRGASILPVDDRIDLCHNNINTIVQVVIKSIIEKNLKRKKGEIHKKIKIDLTEAALRLLPSLWRLATASPSELETKMLLKKFALFNKMLLKMLFKG